MFVEQAGRATMDREPSMISRRIFCFAGACLGLSGAIPTRAASLAAPAGKPILTISGRISVTNKGDTAVFDRESLERLGMTGFTTVTPWDDVPVKYEGVRLDRLMETVGAAGENLLARALEDYTTEIPIVDFARYQPILAMKRNGDYLSVEGKGPLFIVYPFDSDPELKHQRFYGRSAWQVVRMIVF
jgi:hypothetical protein